MTIVGLIDHLGIDTFMVLGFCIGGPFIWNIIERAPSEWSRPYCASPWVPAGEAERDVRRQPERLGGGIGSSGGPSSLKETFENS